MRRTATVFAIVCLAACGSPRAPGSSPKAGAAATTPMVGWRTLGEWSGHGSTQTPSVETVTGQLRVRWHAVNPPGASMGTLSITANSAISGRQLQAVVDENGSGEGTAYVSQDPHVLYFVVEASNLDWSFSVEEAVGGKAAQ